MDTSSSQRGQHLSSTLHIPIEEIIEEVRKELEGGVQLVKYPLIGSPKKRSFRLVGNEFHWVSVYTREKKKKRKKERERCFSVCIFTICAIYYD